MFKRLLNWLFGKKPKNHEPETGCCGNGNRIDTLNKSIRDRVQQLNIKRDVDEFMYRTKNESIKSEESNRGEPLPLQRYNTDQETERKRDDDFIAGVAAGFIANEIIDSSRSDDTPSYSSGSDYSSSSDSSSSFDFGGGDSGGGGASGDW